MTGVTRSENIYSTNSELFIPLLVLHSGEFGWICVYFGGWIQKGNDWLVQIRSFQFNLPITLVYKIVMYNNLSVIVLSLKIPEGLNLIP